ncbi:MAG: ribosome maturation factor RimP [Thermodesulfovibrionales bacterium]|nr:ribosome maturation factor RimP [Thermodesulfovibrionales bacterium]
MDDIKERIWRLARKSAEQEDLEVVDVELSRGKKVLLRVFIDKEGGVTIEDCERMSRALEALLDIEDPIQESYILEVSSPGLDRPLRSKNDFIRNMGRLARVITRDKVDNQNFFVGKIEGADEEGIILNLGKRTVFIRYDNITRANLEVEIR